MQEKWGFVGKNLVQTLPGLELVAEVGAFFSTFLCDLRNFGRDDAQDAQGMMENKYLDGHQRY